MISSLFPFTLASAHAAPLDAPAGLATVLDPLLAVTFTSQETIGIIALVGGLILAGVIVTTVLYFQHQKQRLWHETARLAIERGQPIPAYPATDEERASQPPQGVSYEEWRRYRRGRGLKAGLILMSVGIGLGFVNGQNYYAGAIPFLIGVALVINALIERLWSDDSAGRPPRA